MVFVIVEDCEKIRVFNMHKLDLVNVILKWPTDQYIWFRWSKDSIHCNGQNDHNDQKDKNDRNDHFDQNDHYDQNDQNFRKL